LHKVTYCTTATQFPGSTGAIPFPTANTTQPQITLSSQFTGLLQALALSEPELTEFACLCVRLSTLDEGHSLAVLDKESSKLLKHRQFQQNPHYKEVWDRTYSNELGHLCQGIGTGDKASCKRVAGTNTLHLFLYLDIPCHNHKEIIYTKVVCEIREGKNDKNLPGSQSGVILSSILALQAPTKHC
jgi:hypothetical protein